MIMEDTVHVHAHVHSHKHMSLTLFLHPHENGKQSSVTSPPTYSLIPSILWGWMMITGKQTEAAQINTPQAATKACPPHPKHSFPNKIRFQSSPRITHKQQEVTQSQALKKLTVAETKEPKFPISEVTIETNLMCYSRVFTVIKPRFKH